MWFRRKYRFEKLAREILEQKRLRAKMTFLCAKFRIERLIRHFGGMDLREIQESHWQTYVLKRLKERPGSKIFDDKKYMRQVLLEAYRRGLVDRQIKLPNPDLPTYVGREIGGDELTRLLEHAQGELPFQIQIAFLQGFRLREMLHLRWDQFDWARMTIAFLPTDTKTRKGREVPISPDLASEFRKRFLLRTSKFVFPSPKNVSKPQHNNRVAWRTCKRRAEVKARWHDLRHSCATGLLRHGKTREVVAAYLGMSEKILTRIYQHLNIDDLRDVASSMTMPAPKKDEVSSKPPSISEKRPMPSHG